jgi:hypothetical protein
MNKQTNKQTNKQIKKYINKHMNKLFGDSAVLALSFGLAPRGGKQEFEWCCPIMSMCAPYNQACLQLAAAYLGIWASGMALSIHAAHGVELHARC